MINRDNLLQILLSKKFTYYGDMNNKILIKEYNNTVLKIDLNLQHIFYKECGITVGRETTSNFSENENFVVLFCVDRLLEKGYKPEDIELEPKWKLGHGASGGYADIWIRHKNNDDEIISYLIIECKTPGVEFNDAWQDTQVDGGQLFSYFQQEKSTKYLCLYTCDFNGIDIKHKYFLINVQDNENLIKNTKTTLTYANAKNNKSLFKVWKETYQYDKQSVGLLEDDIKAYDIGKKVFSINELVNVDSNEITQKYTTFANILRKYNISGYENAFDKLVNLFLAKIVDETNNPKELKFYWKGASIDDAYQLIDRLQYMYKIGMKEFLNEDVTYIDEDNINDAFKLFKSDPDATRDTIQDYFRQLKFYTNNDFAFLDVHNERLFNNNFLVLKEMVECFQNIKIITEEQNQFLGNLFEGFLDSGVKQSVGQFFTPLPVVKFIVSCIPLQTVLESSERVPKIIDYACGAGHFLNECASQIKNVYDKINLNHRLNSYYKNIYGIEKEYRLSKVSKVASFMYAQNGINIIYNDALTNIDKITNNSFNILISNPPYSVKGFLETLDENTKNEYNLYKNNEISDESTNKEIQAFFVEKAIKLLSDDGIACIILPFALLTKDGLYTSCREEILKNFIIVSIVELPQITFGETPTSTVVLFLKKRKNNPTIWKHYENRINKWFYSEEKDLTNSVFDDIKLFQNYLNYIDVTKKQYNILLKKKDIDELLSIEYFTDLFESVVKNNEKYKSIEKKKVTDKYTEKDKELDLDIITFEILQEFEKDKLLYYILAQNDNKKVIIVNCPKSKDEQKRYLGYEWKDTNEFKGYRILTKVNNENVDDDLINIQIGQDINFIETPFFNPNDLEDINFINANIKNNFYSNVDNISELIKNYENVQLVNLFDLIDYDSIDVKRNRINKEIDISVPPPEKNYKYSTVKLGKMLQPINNGNIKIEKRDILKSGNIPVITQEKKNIISGYTNSSIFISDVPIIVFGDHSCTFKYIDFNFVRGADGTQLLKFDKNTIDTKFMYYFLVTQKIKHADKYSRHYKFVKNINVPIIDLNLQKSIVKECAKYNNDIEQVEIILDKYLVK